MEQYVFNDQAIYLQLKQAGYNVIETPYGSFKYMVMNYHPDETMFSKFDHAHLYKMSVACF